MRYADLKRFVLDVLTLDPEAPSTMEIVPGPYDPDEPGEYVILTSYGGPGEAAEGTLDQVSWQVRVVGPQNDYEKAEDTATIIDLGFLSWHSGRMFDGGPWLVGIQRVGGAPNPLMRDNADRTHFVCSYILTTELALAN